MTNKKKPFGFGAGSQMATNNTISDNYPSSNTTFLPKCKLLFTSANGGFTVSALPDNSANTQRRHILSYLSQNGSLTTLQARQELGICHPAARVMELRRRGYEIDTVWVNDVDSTGATHMVARYVLNRGGA